MVLATLVLALVLPATALAASTFSDVPPGDPYEAAIEAIAHAGITTGCGGGKFCPTDNITRQQEAVFVQRAGSRVAMSNTLTDPTVSFPAENEVASVTIKVAGTTALGIGANQFVRVDGHVSIAGNGVTAGCPCAYVLFIQESGSQVGQTYAEFPAASSQMNITASWVFPADPGTHTYKLVAYFVGTTDVLTFYYPVIVAQTLPFGAQGTDVLTKNPLKPVKDDTPATAGD